MKYTFVFPFSTSERSANSEPLSAVIGLHADTVESGRYVFLLAASAADIRLTADLVLEDTGEISMGKESYTAVG